MKDRMSQGRLQQRGASGDPPENQREIKSCHIFRRSNCGNQAAGKAEEDEDSEEVAVFFFLFLFFTNISLSLSLFLSLSASPHLMEFLGNVFQL